MAEKGAHLSSTVSGRPSIFDYIAQDSLHKLLHPSLKKFSEAVVFQSPEYFGFLSNYFEEVFFLFNFAVQYYYLKKYDGTFAENFYGLRRVPIEAETKALLQSKLPSKEFFISILTSTLLPYLKCKITNVVDEYKYEGVNATEKNPNFKPEKVLAVKVYNTIQFIHETANFVQHLRYLGGKSDINSPALWLARAKLTYSENMMPPSTSFSIKEWFPLILRRTLELSVFFVQVCNYWKVENLGRIGILPIPPPPPRRGEFKNKMCPLCHKAIELETALILSGYVFCFTCIKNYVTTHNACPITRLPANIDCLIRIYPPN